MNQAIVNINQEWLKVLGKGMVTLPIKWRKELGIEEGDIVKAKKVGNRVVIEIQQSDLAPYRVYSDEEIEEFIKEDKLPKAFVQKVRKDLSSLSS